MLPFPELFSKFSSRRTLSRRACRQDLPQPRVVSLPWSRQEVEPTPPCEASSSWRVVRKCLFTLKDQIKWTARLELARCYICYNLSTSGKTDQRYHSLDWYLNWGKLTIILSRSLKSTIQLRFSDHEIFVSFRMPDLILSKHKDIDINSNFTQLIFWS